MIKISRVSVQKRAQARSMELDVEIPVLLTKEKNKHVAFSPVLELSSYGKTQHEAQKNFAEVLKIFFEEIVEEGTVHEVLQELGWTQERGEWQPPIEVKQVITLPSKTTLVA